MSLVEIVEITLEPIGRAGNGIKDGLRLLTSDDCCQSC